MTNEDFKAALHNDLKKARDQKTGQRLSRIQVAERMSALANEIISTATLNNWTSDSHKKRNMPARYLSFFVQATGGQSRALNLIVKSSGLLCLPGIVALEAQKALLKAAIKNLNLKIRAASKLHRNLKVKYIG